MRRKATSTRRLPTIPKAIRLDPKDAIAYYNRGRAYANKGDHDKAIADYTEAIRLKPEVAEAYYDRGVAYANKGDYAKAIADSTEAIRLDPKYAWAYCNRGVAYEKRASSTRRLPTTPRPSGSTRRTPWRITTGACIP